MPNPVKSLTSTTKQSLTTFSLTESTFSSVTSSKSTQPQIFKLVYPILPLNRKCFQRSRIELEISRTLGAKTLVKIRSKKRRWEDKTANLVDVGYTLLPICSSRRRSKSPKVLAINFSASSNAKAGSPS